MNLAQYWTNDNPRKVWTLTDNAPEWLYNIVHDAHGGMLPHDWIFAVAHDLCDEMDERAEYGIDQDAVFEIADNMTETRTHQLMLWIADGIGLDAVDEYIDEIGPHTITGYTDFVRLVMAAQCSYIERIGLAIFSEIEEEIE